jgi:hypothetical protein
MNYAGEMPPSVLPLPPGLAIFSIVFGVVMMLAFRAASRPDRILRAKRRVQAQLLALRLFGDEPALIWKAQTGLLAANARYLAAMLLPIAAAAVPFLLAYPHLEALYGRAPVPVGGETTLTLRFRQPLNDPLPAPRLDPPAGLTIATPAVRIPDSGEIAWRLRADASVSAPLRIHLGDAEITKAVQAGTAHGYLSDTRAAGALAWIEDPGEAPIQSPGIESLHVDYRAARISFLGLVLPWEAWFVAISMIVALAAKKRLGVVF